jgi:hypothetical protein
MSCEDVTWFMWLTSLICLITYDAFRNPPN